MVETLIELLAHAARDPTAGLRFVDRRERARFVPWPELRDAALPVAGGIQSLGVAAGERVALIFATGPDFFHAFFGILLAGAVPVPLYPPVRLGRLDEYHRRTARMIAAAGCRLVLAEPRIRRLLGETIEAARPDLGCQTLGDLPRADHRPAERRASDLALVQFSSGTTARPKPVALSHRALLAQVRALDDLWRDREQRPSGVSWLPLYHDMGLIGCVLPALDLPAVMTLLPPEAFVARPALWLRTIGRYAADISVAPNFAYALCVEKVRDEQLEGIDLSSWQVALCGAEAVSPTVLRRFTERFARWGFPAHALNPVYGLSEAALAVTFGDQGTPFLTRTLDRDALGRGQAVDVAAAPDENGGEAGVELASVGRPLNGFDVRIVAPDGSTLGHARIGRVHVRGPSLMDGYLGQSEATARVLKDGWLDTGDLGLLDENGYLFLTGRAKDVLILRGRNHDPGPVEHAASAVEGVRSGCVVAVSARRGASATDALLIFAEHARDARGETLHGLADAVTQAVLEGTGLRADAVHVLAPGTLPRTSSGKLRRGDTLEAFEAGTLSRPRNVNALLLGAAMVRSARAYRRERREERG